MYKYEFVTVKGKSSILNPIGLSKTKKDYQRKVHEYAEKGWRLHSTTPPSFWCNDYELVFEKRC